MSEQKFIINTPVSVEETRFYEFKGITGHDPIHTIQTTVERYVVAYLNSEGGRIFFGIRDEDRITEGVRLDFRKRDELRKVIQSKLMNIQPPISPSAYRTEIHNVYANDDTVMPDLFVVEVIVPRVFTNELYCTGGGEIYVKTDSGKKKLNALERNDEIKRRAIKEEEQKLTASIFRRRRNHQIIVTLATIAVFVGVVGSIITIWQALNPKASEDITNRLDSFFSRKTESNENKSQSNSQTVKRTSGKEQGKVAIVKGAGDGYLNLREQPTTESEVIESAYKGDKVVILEFGDEWSKVRFKDKIGYMATEFLKVE